MTPEEIEATIVELVQTKYPYQVGAILDRIPADFFAVIVAAALFRSVALGRVQGRKAAQDDLRSRLGL